MNCLLDSHTFIWSIIDKDKLSKLIIQTLENSNNEIFISAISIWEISLKFSLRKMNLDGLTPNELPDLALQLGFKIIPLNAIESSSYHQLILTNHKDPFDRMLIWQAIQQNLTFISKDKSISQYSLAGLKTL
jgi:PIN domain nuclease of toxin-antitoxin system